MHRAEQRVHRRGAALLREVEGLDETRPGGVGALAVPLSYFRYEGAKQYRLSTPATQSAKARLQTTACNAVRLRSV